MKKVIIITILALVMLITPIMAVSIYAVNTSTIYADTFLGAMADKYDRLNSINEPKIILVGGSSMAFGVDSEVMERELGMPVVNMGLYAGIGSKTTLELTRSNINKDDIVIFAPETDSQAYSMYFDAENTLEMLSANRSMIKHLPIGDRINMFANLPRYFEGLRKVSDTGMGEQTGAYTRTAFNERGDNIYDRPYNIMTDGYMTTNMINIDKDIVHSDFVEYLNDYIRYVESRHAKVLFSYAPMNRLALTEDSTYERRLEFDRYIRDNIKCEVISNVEEYIMDEGYFYDSNYHLNNSGITYRTYALISDVKRLRGDSSKINYSIAVPSGFAPNNGNVDSSEDDGVDYSKIFDYEDKGGYIEVQGLKEGAKNATTLEVPIAIDGMMVKIISSDAFSGSNATKIIVHNSLNTILDGTFSGLNELEVVELIFDAGDTVPTVGTKLLDGANSSLKVAVPESKYGQMITDYFWSIYADIIVGI